MKVKEIWQELEKFFESDAPRVNATLNPGIGPDKIEAFERQFDLKIPEDFKESLMIHNGHPKNNYIHFIVIKDSYWLWPLEEIIEECNYRVNVAKQKLTSLPFAYAGTGDKLYISLSSDPNKYGRVNMFSHDGGGGNVSKSFEAFLEYQYRRMRSKEIVPNKDGWFSLA